MKRWKHLSSRTLFIHPRLTIAEEEVALPNGERTDWLTIDEGGDSVCVICLNERNEVLVAKQYCAAPRSVIHEFPGGRIDLQESVQIAAQRELREEVGILCDKVVSIGSFYPHNRRSSRLCHVVAARKSAEVPPSPDKEEFIEWEWVQVEELNHRLCEMKNATLLAAWALFMTRDWSA